MEARGAAGGDFVAELPSALLSCCAMALMREAAARAGSGQPSISGPPTREPDAYNVVVDAIAAGVAALDDAGRKAWDDAVAQSLRAAPPVLAAALDAGCTSASPAPSVDCDPRTAARSSLATTPKSSPKHDARCPDELFSDALEDGDSSAESAAAAAPALEAKVSQERRSRGTVTRESMGLDAKASAALAKLYEVDDSLAATTADVGQLISETSGRGRSVFVTGIGKSGLVASRMASSLMSIGVPAQYVHGTEWVHGGLGATRPGDVVVMLSNSGKTRELLDAAGHLIARGVTLVAIVGHPTSPLARTAHHVLWAPSESELLGCVPTRSIVAATVLVNALLSEVSAACCFSADRFRSNHPGGAIGGNPRRESNPAAGEGGRLSPLRSSATDRSRCTDE